MLTSLGGDHMPEDYHPVVAVAAVAVAVVVAVVASMVVAMVVVAPRSPAGAV